LLIKPLIMWEGTQLQHNNEIVQRLHIVLVLVIIIIITSIQQSVGCMQCLRKKKIFCHINRINQSKVSYSSQTAHV